MQAKGDDVNSTLERQKDMRICAVSRHIFIGYYLPQKIILVFKFMTSLEWISVTYNM
jgi:hypothetical protein